MKINPTAILFLAVCAAIGFLVGDITGAIIGFVIAGSISILGDLIQ